MKRIFVFGLVLALLASFMAPATPFGAAQVQASASQTYQVIVGYGNVQQGALVNAFFPDTVTIHVWDTVHWVQGAHEIHTVSFLAGGPALDLLIPAPQPNPVNTPLMFNPVVAFPTPPFANGYDGSTYANSGILSLDPGNPTSFDLTFTTPGTYDYLCLVHGVTMSGKVIVLPANKHVPSPAQTTALGKLQLAKQVSKIGDVIEQAAEMVTPPSRNKDGSTTYNIMIGFSKGQIDLMRFFPRHLNVRQGDTVVWSYGMKGMSMAPHTVTFLNGNPDISLVVPVPAPPAIPQMLLLNPMVLGPLQPGQPLTRNGYFSSGLLAPGSPNTSLSLKIGNVKGEIDYQCLLHDTSGMVASLNVLPKH